MKKLYLSTACAAALLLAACSQDPATPNTESVVADTHEPADAHAVHGADAHDDAHHHEHEHGHAHQDLPLEDISSAAATTTSVYLTEGDWKDQHGNAFSLNDLQGRKQVVAFVYTNCKHACPVMVQTMKRIQNKLTPEDRAKTEFLLISFDPERDTPDILNHFAQDYNLDDKWRLLNGSDEDVRMLANTMNIRYQPSEGGHFAHSNAVSVLDENGVMIEQAVGTTDGEDKIVAAIAGA